MEEFNNKLTREEKKFIWLVCIILIIITAIPYFYGYLIKGQDFYYTGINIFSPGDGPVYFSFIEQVKQGSFLLDDLHTNELNYTQLFNPFWFLVGLTAKIFSLPAAWAYHLFRLILTPIFLFSLYKFCSLFLAGQTDKRKKLCFLYSIFATGLGGLFYIFFLAGLTPYYFFDMSMDIWVQESSNFLIILNSPHFIASISLIIGTFYFFFKSLETKQLKNSILAGILALLLFSFHPFYIPTIYLIPLAYLAVLFVINRKIYFQAILSYLILVLISLPSVIYYGYMLWQNVSLQIKNSQNLCLTPGGAIFFVSYGLGLLLAIFASVYLLEKERKKLSNYFLFLIVWFWLGILLLYGPFSFQRRLTEGWQIPLTILAFWGMLIIYDNLKIRWPAIKEWHLKRFLVIFIFFFCFSNILVYVFDFYYLAAKDEPIYLRLEIKKALDWYAGQTSFQETLLTSKLIGNITPGLIARRVYWGHDIETLNYKWKMEKVLWFFRDNQDDQDKKDFLSQNRIDYIFYSDREKGMGSFNPAEKDYLQEVYNQDGVGIYRVKLLN